MKKKQIQDKSKQKNIGVVDDRVTADKSTDKKGKDDKQGAGSGAELGAMNNDLRTKQK